VNVAVAFPSIPPRLTEVIRFQRYCFKSVFSSGTADLSEEASRFLACAHLFWLIARSKHEPSIRRAKNKRRSLAQAITIVSLLLMFGALLPAAARAGIIADFFAAISGTKEADADTAPDTQKQSLQTLALPRPATNLNPTPLRGGGDVTIVGGVALLPQEGPSGTIADIDKPQNDKVSTYVVQPGDTIEGIAKMYNVTPATILSVNDVSSASKLQIGQKLTILNVPGYKYTVKKGDTLESVAKAFGGDAAEIATRNDLANAELTVGSEIIIPNVEAPAPTPSAPKAHQPSTIARIVGHLIPFANNPAEPAHNVGSPGTADQIAYYLAPLSHYTQTQGIHGYNAVDLAAPTGTAIRAAADGTVTVAHEGGWNGGYGSYVVISHSNGAQTLYAHMSKVNTSDGAAVSQGDVIGYVGSTGESTGPHLHFEIRNGIRNPF
jgi:LysM repeat protein